MQSYGFPTGKMEAICSYFLMKLASADGSEIWQTQLPAGGSVTIGTIRIASDKSGFGVGTIEGLNVDFGGSIGVVNSTVVDGVAVSSPLIIKWDASGNLVWTKIFGSGSGADLDLSQDNSKLVMMFYNTMETTVDGVALTNDHD